MSRATACEPLGVGRTRLDTMLRDGLIASFELEDVLHTRAQRWVTVSEAATIWGCTTSVGQLVDAGRLPCHQADRSRALRWFRAGQVEVIANARGSLVGGAA